MNRYLHPDGLTLTVLSASLTFLTPCHTRAAAPVSYTIHPIVKAGDQVGSPPVKIVGNFEIGTLNDNGQLIFAPQSGGNSEAVIQDSASSNTFTPIVDAGQPGPLGAWSKDVGLAAPVSMNQRGDVVFNAGKSPSGVPSFGVFRWDAQKQQVSAVVLKDMPAVQNLTFADPGGGSAAINNRDEIAFVAGMKNAAGKVAYGIYFLGPNGPLQAVALPDQELPGGGKFGTAFFSYLSLSDAGVVAFEAQRQGDPGKSGYLWENGTITPVALVGADAPGGGTFAAVFDVQVNNQNRTAVVAARLKSGANALYRFANGQLAPAAVPGLAMPGGGTLTSVQTYVLNAVGLSAANASGQHAFLARIDEGGASHTAAYRLDPDGTLSLILKSGATTDLGTISVVGAGSSQEGIGLNSQGQVAVAVNITGGKSTLVLLTPSQP